MNVTERLTRYAKVDTQSDEFSTATPSTQKQFVLAEMLKEELTGLGLVNIELTDSCIVYGTLEANTEGQPCIGFLAHMDTSPAASGENIKPRVIENYDGGEIVLNEELRIVMTPEQFPQLLKDKGCDLLVTDGTTLLGGDDKAGITAIMGMLEYCQEHPEFKHGRIAVAFTPDEEVGRGVENFSIERFGADFAYTVDGFNADELCYDCFFANSAEVKVHGLSIHPGSAKGKMKNSLLIAMEFQSLLPTFDNPMYTADREGFNHLCDMQGDCEDTVMHYIIRNHDLAKLNKQVGDFKAAAAFLNYKYGKDTITLDIRETYRNMRERIEQCPEVLEKASAAIRSLGYEPVSYAVRGGTDGAGLTAMGLPTPNLGTGDRNCHGKFEYVNLNELEKVVEVLKEIVRVPE
jgi:tripeptide aminopeptidase